MVAKAFYKSMRTIQVSRPELKPVDILSDKFERKIMVLTKIVSKILFVTLRRELRIKTKSASKKKKKNCEKTYYLILVPLVCKAHPKICQTSIYQTLSSDFRNH